MAEDTNKLFILYRYHCPYSFRLAFLHYQFTSICLADEKTC